MSVNVSYEEEKRSPEVPLNRVKRAETGRNGEKRADSVKSQKRTESAECAETGLKQG